MNRRLITASLICLFLAGGDLTAQTAFREVWAYLDNNDRGALIPSLPLTDVAVFAASINSRGVLVDIPAPLGPSMTKARKHLVVAELGNTALTHFVLDPVFPLRDALVAAIAERMPQWDGVQIDFESVARVDRDDYLRFLLKLKNAIGNKVLSVAVPARWKAVDDAQDYVGIASVADRLVVMAYDEHWSTSAPGAIASVEWGSKVATYALKLLGPQKLVMGLPFYGRVWGASNPAGGYRWTGVQRLVTENAAVPERDAGGVPFFKFSKAIDYTVWFEDAVSLQIKTALYQGLGVRNIGFWRLGQEDPAVWGVLQPATAQP